MTQGAYTTPGVVATVVREEAPALPDSGVPVFLGAIGASDPAKEQEPIETLSAFLGRHGAVAGEGVLGRALAGYFANRGGPCFVFTWSADDPAGLADALRRSLSIDGIDLVCAPGITTLDSQRAILSHCAETGERFAILDAPAGLERLPADAWAAAASQAQTLRDEGLGPWGSLYFPWLRISADQGGGGSTGASSGGALITAPPSGHLAGQRSHLDREVGIHMAAAGRHLEGALDVTCVIAEPGADAAWLNPIRPRRGHGIVPWGARTLSADETWAWIGVRRVVLTVSRHARTLLEQLAFEVNDITLWMRVHRTLGDYLQNLYQTGALSGRTANEAWYIKCDDENNPMELRKRGELLVEVGVAPTCPMEYIVLRILRGAEQTLIT